PEKKPRPERTPVVAPSGLLRLSDLRWRPIPSQFWRTSIVTAELFTTTITGAARIGPNRELKRATETYWAGSIDRAELERVAADLRRDTWTALSKAGLDSVPVNTFSYYDQILDTAELLGALPR